VSAIARLLLLACLMLPSWRAGAVTIEQVLVASQQQRLAERGQPDAGATESVHRLRTSFERLRSQVPALADVELIVVGGELFAEAVFGRRAVAASVAVGELPEGERMQMLAHGMGHLQLRDWDALAGLYHHHIPGEVRPETTEPVAAALGAQARQLSWRHEFEADAWGYRLARQFTYGVDTASGLLTRQGVSMDSATHPGTRRRIMQLRMLDAELSNPQFLFESSQRVDWRGDGAASGR
jgi:hypothetical protein